MVPIPAIKFDKADHPIDLYKVKPSGFVDENLNVNPDDNKVKP